MDNKPIRILLIEDNAGDARLIQEQLKEVPEISYSFKRVSQLQEGLQHLNQHETDVVLSDLSLPDSPGLETFKRLQSETPEIPVVVVTGFDNESAALDAVREGAQDYLIKGQVDARGLSRTILYAIERHRTQASLRSLSLTDEMTGLYNRRGFMTLGEQALKSALRAKSQLFLYYADLDGLKKINDTYGHKEGDHAIKGAGEILKKTFRQSDIVARIGGDEFAILAAEDHNRGSDIIISRLLGNLAHYNMQNPREYTISLSVGVSRFDPKSPVSIEELMGEADKILYVSKGKKKSPAFRLRTLKFTRQIRLAVFCVALFLGGAYYLHQHTGSMPFSRTDQPPRMLQAKGNVPLKDTTLPSDSIHTPASHIPAGKADNSRPRASSSLTVLPPTPKNMLRADIRQEMIPQNVTITRFSYQETIVSPGKEFSFDIVGTGFTPELMSKLNIYIGSPHVKIQNLRMATVNEIRGKITVLGDAKTQYVFPYVLIDEIPVFQAANPFAIIRRGDVLDIIFTKMEENGHAGHFRVYAHLDSELARQFHLVAGSPDIEISPLQFNLPYRIEGVLRIDDAVPRGAYGLSAFLGAKEVFRKDRMIQVTRPMMGSTGYIQKLFAVTPFRRPGDTVNLVIQGSGFTPGLAELLKGRVDGLNAPDIPFLYHSPGRLTGSFVAPPDIYEKSYSVTLYKGPEVVFRERETFMIVQPNWIESFQVTPVAKPGQKSNLILIGRDFSPSFAEHLSLSADDAGIRMGRPLWVNSETLKAELSIDYAVTPGDYVITLNASGVMVKPRGGNLITVSAP